MANYSEVSQKIREYIEENNMKAGEQLPSEAEFSKILGISRLKLREALNGLKTEGRIYAVQGKGTFVAYEMDNIENILNYNLGVTEMIRAHGYIPGVSKYKKSLEKANKKVAASLSVKEGVDILRCSRVRSANNTPIGYTTDYLSPRIAQSFISNMDEKVSLYDFIEKDCGIAIGISKTELIPAKADATLSELLEVPKDTLLMKFQMVLNDVLGEPLVYAEEYFRTDMFHFVVLRTRK